MLDDVQHQKGFLRPKKQALFLGAVFLLHLLIIYGVASGLSGRFVKTKPHLVEVQLIQEIKPVLAPAPALAPKPAPLPSPVAKSAPPPKTPIPDVVPVAEATPSTTPMPNAPLALSPSTKPASSPEQPLSVQAPSPSVKTPAVINASINCETPVYPSASRRMQETGTVQLRFHIGLDGKVMESQIERSSGFKRLDEAARVALSKCQFKPATVDGQPEASWSSLRYVWKIDD